MKAQRPDLLVGWDAPGEEDAGHPTLDYARQLLAAWREGGRGGLERFRVKRWVVSGGVVSNAWEAWGGLGILFCTLLFAIACCGKFSCIIYDSGMFDVLALTYSPDLLSKT